MKLLIDITHPAYAHFFRPMLPRLRKAGWDIHITSRDKDITCLLLDRYGIEHTCISRHGGRKIALLLELFVRCFRLVREVHRFKPDILLARDGLFVGIVGFLTGTPSISFDDTDDATLQRWLYFPFASRIYIDRNYPARPNNRLRFYRSVACLSYLRPSVFRPDPNVLARYGLCRDDRIIIVRLVSWSASHDFSHGGVQRRELADLMNRLNQMGKVVLTSEELIEGDFCHIRVDPLEIHHVMAFSTLYIGESATMAAESAVLGVPAVYISTRCTWYTKMLQRDYGLIYHTTRCKDGLEQAIQLLQDPTAGDRHRAARRRYLASCDDLSTVVEHALEATLQDALPQPSKKKETPA